MKVISGMAASLLGFAAVWIGWPLAGAHSTTPVAAHEAQVKPRPPRVARPRTATAQAVVVTRDKYGVATIQAEDYFSAGYGVGRVQAQELGLDLQMMWRMLDPEVESLLDGKVFLHLLPGQFSTPVQEFDQYGMPKPVQPTDRPVDPDRYRQPGTPTLPAIFANFTYFGFYRHVAEAAQRIEGTTLHKYLLGYVAGVNDQFAAMTPTWLASADPRIRYMVQRGLHEIPVTILDPIAVGMRLGLDPSISVFETYVSNIDKIQPPALEATAGGSNGHGSNGHGSGNGHAGNGRGGNGHGNPNRIPWSPFPNLRLPPTDLQSSNELGVTGAATASGRPILVADPHLPTHEAFWNRAVPIVVHAGNTIRMLGIIPPGCPVPTLGQAHHPEFGTSVGLTGVSNGCTPMNVWFASVTADLRKYRSYLTASSPDGYFDFAIEAGPVPVRSGTHGRLIGYRQDWGLGFLFRFAKDFDFDSIESLWQMFHARDVAEFRRGLDLHQLPHWSIIAGFSSPGESSRLLYVSNSIAPRRYMPPQRAPDFFSYFLSADDPSTDWLGGYHTATELPTREIAGTDDLAYLHCHNCSHEKATGFVHPIGYLYGGYSGYDTFRQEAGDRVYAAAIRSGSQLTAESLVPIVNDKQDLQIEEAISKLAVSAAAYGALLPPAEYLTVLTELAHWTSGQVDADAANTRIGRVVHWQQTMRNAGVGLTSTDLLRIAYGFRNLDRPGFDPATPLEPADAVAALHQLALASGSYDQVYRRHGDPAQLPWSTIQRFRPAAKDYPMAGSAHALMSVSSAAQIDPDGIRRLCVYGGQNFVLIMELGGRTLLKKSVHGTYDPASPYADYLSDAYALESFVLIADLATAMPVSAVVSSQRFVAR